MKSRTQYAVKVTLAAVLAGGTLLSAGAAVLTLGGKADLLDLAPRAEERANAVLADPVPDLAFAETQTRTALAQAPMTATAWARLAYIEQARTGRMTPAALDAMERSYAVAPFGPDVTNWRLRFLFESWTQLTPSLRTQAMDELRVLSRYRGGAARKLVEEIQNPSGRLAADMVRSLGQGDAAKDRKEREAATA